MPKLISTSWFLKRFIKKAIVLEMHINKMTHSSFPSVIIELFLFDVQLDHRVHWTQTWEYWHQNGSEHCNEQFTIQFIFLQTTKYTSAKRDTFDLTISNLNFSFCLTFRYEKKHYVDQEYLFIVREKKSSFSYAKIQL